jgi:purine nucleosidase
LLDTDIGSDIDDALALAYLLRQPHCHLMGVSTVSGEASRRAALVHWLCAVAGKPEIPVYCGTELPLLGEQRQPHAPQFNAIPAQFAEVRHPASHAVDFLRDEITKRPGEISLLAIGPLTNVALLFATYPFIPQMLRSLVVMGGTFRTPGADTTAEWNIQCDPAAAALVFERSLHPFLAVGLNVTTRCKVSSTAFNDMLGGSDPLKAAVKSMANVWFASVPEVTFHDPLAAALIFEPDICATANTHAEVCLHPPGTKGATLESPDWSYTPHNIAVTVDTPRFFAHYSTVLNLTNTIAEESI